jgi:predicted SnoaL-like aldol condensation-catalyzing enzyme
MKQGATVLALVLICGLLSGCGGDRRDLVSTVKQFDEAWNAHDRDRVLSFFTDAAVVTGPDGKVYSGKSQIGDFVGGLIAGFHVRSWGFEQSGDTVTWTSKVKSSAFPPVWMDEAGVTTRAVFSGDKISSFTPKFDKETSSKMLAMQFYQEVIGNKNIDVMDKMMSADFVEHEALPPGIPPGREGVKAFFKMYHAAFSNVQVKPIVVMADGDKVLVFAQWEGTHTGTFMGMRPTRRKVSYAVMDIVRIKDGVAVEHWGLADTETMMRQIRGM